MALSRSRGVTLLELLVVMMVLGLILTAAVKTWDVTLERGRFETTRSKLNQLAEVIVGDPDHVVSGNRVDFGYVGDMGSLPDSLGNLVRLPPGLPVNNTWRGPYIQATFRESEEGYRIDGWGDDIVYSRDSLFVRSSGGPSGEPMTRSFNYAEEELLDNKVRGRMLFYNQPELGWWVSGNRFQVRFSGPVNGQLVNFTVTLQNDQVGHFVVEDVPQGNAFNIFVDYRSNPAQPWENIVHRSMTVYPKGPGLFQNIEFRPHKETW